MEIPHTHKSGSKYLQPMSKKSSHNRKYNQTNPKLPPKPKTKPKKLSHKASTTTKTKKIVKNYSKPSYAKKLYVHNQLVN